MSELETPTPMGPETPPPAAEPPRDTLWTFLGGVGLGLMLGLAVGIFGNPFITAMLKGPYQARLAIIAFGALSTIGSLALVFSGKHRGLAQGFLTGMALGFMLCAACFGLMTVH